VSITVYQGTVKTKALFQKSTTLPKWRQKC